MSAAGICVDVRVALGAFTLDACFDAPDAGVTALIGPSGSGKSTVLRCLAGLESTATGRLVVAGDTWLDDARRVCVPPHRRGVGMVFQDASLLPHLSVRRNLEYARRRRPPRPGAISFDDAVAELGIGALLDRGVDRLSGGERQRVAIARALLAGPRLLLLDEPLASLDPPARAEILELLRELLGHAPMPVLYVTHARSEAVQLADHVVVLEAGRVRASGPLGEVALRTVSGAFGDVREQGAVLAAEVVEVDPVDEVSLLRCEAGCVVIPGRLRVGTRRRIEILARDVSLALERPHASSILNVYAARVLDVRDAESSQPLVVLAVGDTRLLARISRRSFRQLGVRAGTSLFAQVKGVAVVP